MVATKEESREKKEARRDGAAKGRDSRKRIRWRTRAERPRLSTKFRNKLVSLESKPGKKARGRRLAREAQRHPALQQAARTPKVAKEQRQANANDRWKGSSKAQAKA